MAQQNQQDNDLSFYNHLKKLLKQPSVRYKIPTNRDGSTYQRRIVSQFQKASNNLYLQSIAGSTDRLARMRDFEMMDQNEILSAALNIYADCAVMNNEDGRVLEIKSTSEKIQKALYELFYDRLQIDFHIWQWVRNICKYGDMFILLDVLEDKGIVNHMALPTVEIEREEGFDGDINSVRFKWLQGQGSVFDNFQVAHFRILGDDTFLPYGRSILEPVRKLWKQLNLIEDAYIVYFITRAPEKRVFKIDVGGIDANNIPALMQKAKDILKSKGLVDSTGNIDLRYAANDVQTDYFIPIRGKDGGSDITTLPGAQNLEPHTLNYLQAKLFAGLGIPKAYLSYTEDVAGKNVLSQVDVTFARTVSRIQKMVIAELNKIAMIHLYGLGIDDPEDLTNFKLQLTNSSSVDEMQKLDLFAKRFEIYASAIQSVGVDRNWAQKHILKLSKDEVKDINVGVNKDAKFNAEVQQIAAEVQQANAPQQTAGQETNGNTQQQEPTPVGMPPIEAIPGGQALPVTQGDSSFKNDPDNPMSQDRIEEDGELFDYDKSFKNDRELLQILKKYDFYNKKQPKKDWLAKVLNENTVLNTEMLRIFKNINNKVKKS